MSTALRAGFVYFLIIFAIGLVLGTCRGSGRRMRC